MNSPALRLASSGLTRRRPRIFTPSHRQQNKWLSGSSGKDERQNYRHAASTDSRQQKRKSDVHGNLQQPRRQERRKRTTLDDFFANFGKDRESNRTGAQTRQRAEQRPSKEATSDFSAAENIKKVEMSSFFDEVNEIMRKNKEENDARTEEKTNLRNSSMKENKPRMSMLDLLPPVKPKNPNAYDEDTFDEYMEMLESIEKDPKFLGKHRGSPLESEAADYVIEWLQADGPTIAYSLPTLDKASKGDMAVSEEESARADLRKDLLSQRERFIDHHGWSKMQYDGATGALFKLGNMCAKNFSGPPVEIAWEKLKEAGYNMNQATLQNYLYVSSTFCVRAIPNLAIERGSVLDFLDGKKEKKKENVLKEKSESRPNKDIVDTATEVALCHDIMFEPSEQSTIIRVRVLVSQGKARQAERLLDSNPTDNFRLRTYDPVFQCYLEQGDVSAALKMYSKMKVGEKVQLRPETYIQLISCIAENGHFKTGAPPIDGAKSLGYLIESGPQLFDSLVAELADDAVEISSASAKRLHNALSSGFDDHNLRPLHLLEALEVSNNVSKPTELVASRMSLDLLNGKCPKTGVKLRLINLDAQQKEQLKDGLFYLSTAAYEERSAGKKSSIAEDQLRLFGSWLQHRPGKPFTAIVDGPNIAYYFQNFEQGTFNFHQIKFVVDALEKMGENVLVILPKKYTQKSFMLMKSTGKVRQTLTQKEHQIRDSLVSAGQLYVVPPSLLDDYYWMYASVCNQGDKWADGQDYIPPNNPEGRWPGIRPMLISNDKMRDHKLSLLEPRLFRRWYSNFIVNFTFSAFIGDQCVDKEIGFSTADFYSREIQGNVTRNEGGDEVGTAWHFPVSDWGERECFCVRIPSC